MDNMQVLDERMHIIITIIIIVIVLIKKNHQIKQRWCDLWYSSIHSSTSPLINHFNIRRCQGILLMMKQMQSEVSMTEYILSLVRVLIKREMCINLLECLVSYLLISFAVTSQFRLIRWFGDVFANLYKYLININEFSGKDISFLLSTEICIDGDGCSSQGHVDIDDICL